MNITYFDTCRDVNNPKILPISDIFNATKNGEYEYHAIALKNLKTDDEQRKYKASKIPAVIFNGEFSRRSNDSLIKHNGLCTLDGDHLENAEEIKKQISEDEHVFMCGLSPRLNGVKFLARMPIVKNDAEYKLHYSKIKTYFENKFNIVLDKACTDIARLTFVLPDRDLYINPNAKELNLINEDVEIIDKNENKTEIIDIVQKNEETSHVSFTKLEYSEKKHIPLWFEDFCLNYIMNHQIPSPRHPIVEKNLVIGFRNHEKWAEIKKRYCEIQRDGSDTLQTWEKAFENGKYPDVNVLEVAKYITDNNVPFKIRKNNEFKKTEKKEIENAITIFSKPIEKVKFIIENVLPENSIVFMVGNPGGKKTLFAQYLALCVVNGKSLLNKYPCKKSNLLYLNEENDKSDFIIRLKRMCVAHEIDEKKLDGLFISNFQNFKINEKPKYEAVKNEEFIEEICEFIEKNNIKIVVIDSFVRFLIGEENSSSDVRSCFDTLKDVIKRCNGVSFIILHHLGKDAKKGMRGSSDLKGMASLTLHFKNNIGFTSIKPDKVRFMPESKFANLDFKLEDLGEMTSEYYDGMEVSEGLYFSQSTEKEEIDANLALAKKMHDYCISKEWTHFKNKQLFAVFCEEKNYPKSTFNRALKNGLFSEYWKFTNETNGNAGYSVIFNENEDEKDE